MLLVGNVMGYVTHIFSQLLMSALLEPLPESPASYRRMAASVLHSITTHAKSPEAHTHWLVEKMMSKPLA